MAEKNIMHNFKYLDIFHKVNNVCNFYCSTFVKVTITDLNIFHISHALGT